MRVRGPPREVGLEMPGPRGRGPNHPLVRPVGAPLPRQVAEGPVRAGQDMCGENVQGQPRLHLRLTPQHSDGSPARRARD